MAQALLSARLAGRDIQVESAGVGALVGRPAEPPAVALMAERELDISEHRARQVNQPMVMAADLLFAMDQGQVSWLLEQYAFIRGRVFRLGHWRDEDVPDPFGGSEADFADALAVIERCIEDWVNRL